MIYLDAAYVAKCYLNEPGAERVRELAGQSPGLCSLELARLEFACILHRHVREAHVTRREARQVLADFRSDEEDGVWHWFPATSALIDKARTRVSRVPRGAFLRAVDALHLACAQDNGFQRVYTNDRHMLACASRFGLEGIDVIASGLAP